MATLGIIPARGGSKRLPRKNLRLLGGIPLVRHTIEAATRSGCLDRVLVSSDDPEILAQTSGSTAEPWPRSQELAGDRVTALDLVLSILEEDGLGPEFDAVALMLPTAPLRTARHIREAFSLLEPGVDGVVSLTEYEFPPQLSVRLEGGSGRITPVFDPSPLLTGDTRSQDQATIFRPNGALYLQRMESFLVNRNFWRGNVVGYAMDRRDSVDIDDSRDLAYAEFVLSRQDLA